MPRKQTNQQTRQKEQGHEEQAGKLPHWSDDQFESEVLEARRPVLVDFTATWCGPCKGLAPILEEVAPSFARRIKIGKVDVDQAGVTAARYHVKSIPTLMVFRKGEVVRESVGLLSRDALKRFLDGALRAGKRWVPRAGRPSRLCRQ